MIQLGESTWNLNVLVEAVLSGAEIAARLQELVKFIGMDTAGMPPTINTYPLWPEDRGGEGQTIYQPFVEPATVMQPLTTSYIIADAWPELGHIDIMLKSCRRFSVHAVLSMVSRLFGPLLNFHDFRMGRVVR